MKIGVIAPAWEQVPPKGYGGTEVVVDYLTKELAKDGANKIWLACSSDSRITNPRIRRVETSVSSLRNSKNLTNREKLFYERRYISEAFNGMIDAGVDIIHNHSGEVVMEFARKFAASCGTPILTTTHNMPTPCTMPMWNKYRGYWNTISTRQRKAIGDGMGGTYVGAIYNAIDVKSFELGGPTDKQNYLLFVGRFSPEKGLHLAIEAALQTGIPITIAAKEPDCERDVNYKRTFVDPLLKRPGVSYIGEVGPAEKRKLYKHARALLVPIQWEEPFGLVLVEALASGTPVIAFKRGAAPEIVVKGITGYLVNDVAGMVNAIRNLDSIQPNMCRIDMFNRFDLPVMAKAYRDHYQQITELEEMKNYLPASTRKELYA